MVSFRSTFAHFVSAISIASSLFPAVTFAAPAVDLVARKAHDDSGPRFVTYTDKWIPGETGPPDASLLQGFNTLILSFWLSTGPADQALQWSILSDSDRSSYISKYHAAGIKLMVSAFGATESPTSSGADPIAIANKLATFVKQYSLDGVDVDYEDFGAFNSGTPSGVNWLVSFTKQLRSQLPAGQYIITHAPVAPWFQKGYTGGGYLAVHQQAGSFIDWYNIQFYNQGTLYTDCNSLISTSGGQWPGTSVLEIAANGVPMNKLVIGKPGTTSDQQNGGFLDAATLSQCVAQAKASGWSAGVMGWQYPNADSNWMTTVRGNAFAA